MGGAMITMLATWSCAYCGRTLARVRLAGGEVVSLPCSCRKPEAARTRMDGAGQMPGPLILRWCAPGAGVTSG